MHTKNIGIDHIRLRMAELEYSLDLLEEMQRKLHIEEWERVNVDVTTNL